MPTYPDLKLYIGGQWRSTPETMPVLNPSDESVLGALPIARQADLDDALAAAAQGLKVWSRTSPRKRAEIMKKLDPVTIPVNPTEASENSTM